MFFRTEQNATEKAVIAKLLAFKQVLAEHPVSSNLRHRFYLDVLKDILDEAIPTTSLVFPLTDDDRTEYEHHLYQQVDLFYLKDTDELKPETIQTLFYKYDRTLPNSNGIVLHQNKLYALELDKKRKVTAIRLIENNSDSQAYAKLSASILTTTQQRYISSSAPNLAKQMII